MKKIEAIIKPPCLEEVKERLRELGIDGMTLSEVKGCGRTSGHREVFRGSVYVVDSVSKIRIEILVQDGMLREVVAAIAEAAWTGSIGDGKILVSTVDEEILIGADRCGEAAI
jgi:nitrogen regulatory protein P-II 1